MGAELPNINNRLLALINTGIASRIALITTFTFHKTRIFVRGLDSQGSQIGHYSTKPISISKKNQAKQTGRTRFKGGYAEYKSAIGKNPGFVNLRNTDQLYGDYSLTQTGRDFGFGFSNPLNSQKAGWVTEKYDKEIFPVSDQELEMFANILVKETIARL